MKKRRPIQLNRRMIAVCLAALFLLSLIPILAVAKYNHSYGDDYAYGYDARLACEASGSYLSVFGGAAKTVARRYYAWQGTFSAMYLMSLQPAVFAEELYALCPFLFLGMLMFATWVFVREVFGRLLGADSASCVILSVILLFFCVQCAPDATEAFFWFNGSVYYLFFHGLLLLLVALICRFLRLRRAGRRSIFSMIAIPLLALIISGGNYTTMLILFVLLVALNIAMAACRRFHWLYAVTLALFLAGMLVNVLAPGNALRQAYAGEGMNPVMAMLSAVKASMQYFTKWTTVPLVVSGAFFVPLVWPIVRRTGFSFRFPMLFTVASFAILSVGFVPPLYGMRTASVGRLLNAQYALFLTLFFANLIYYTGWIARVIGDAPLAAKLRPFAAGFTLFCTILFVIGCCPPVARSFTSWRAAEIWLDGSAAQYDAEIRQRLALFEGGEAVVHVPPLSVRPALVSAGELSEDSDYYANVGMARFFGKDEVILDPPAVP